MFILFVKFSINIHEKMREMRETGTVAQSGTWTDMEKLVQTRSTDHFEYLNLA